MTSNLVFSAGAVTARLAGVGIMADLTIIGD